MQVMQSVLEGAHKTFRDLRSVVGHSVRQLLQTASTQPSEDLSRALGPAIQALRGGSETSTMLPSSPATPITREMINSLIGSYTYDRTLGRVTCMAPAGCEFSGLMKALNEAYRERYPGAKRDAVSATDLRWYDRLPHRDISQERLIAIIPVVKGTEGMDRKQQEEILRTQGLTFADPRDIALAAALHAYHHQGDTLLAGRWVRCSEPGFGMDIDRRSGIFVFKYDPAYPYRNNAAAGSPA